MVGNLTPKGLRGKILLGLIVGISLVEEYHVYGVAEV